MNIACRQQATSGRYEARQVYGNNVAKDGYWNATRQAVGSPEGSYREERDGSLSGVMW